MAVSNRDVRTGGARPRARGAAAALCLAACAAAFLPCSCRTAPRPGHPEEADFSPKSVILGELIAIFPGIIWHGLGHRYAGDTAKAEEIEQMEALSLLAAGVGTGLVFAGRSNDNLMSLQVSGYTVGGIGALGFVGTWLYDIIYTPAAIDRYNRYQGQLPNDDR
ncbi:MAG TPA: hypothetical protein DCM87_22170 [Planctomycetes bacterium]|jgi:hypothetical protein|nr:hypothetical protein [Planctomycetota bacterium]